MKWRHVVLSCIAICLLLPNIVAPAAAAASNVKVTIPKFTIELNGKKIDNVHALHPALVYKGVTYLPMTVEYGKALGLIIQWNKKTGLAVQSGGGSARMPWKADRSGNNSLSRSYTAQIASFPIKVNEVKINNAKEKYPLLRFRDIMYLPMTGRFTNELFHWETEWNAKTGYHIRSVQEPVLYRFLDDDANFLYVMTGSIDMLKISKALDGKFTRLNKEETRKINEKVEAKSNQYAPPQSIDAEGVVTAHDNSVYFKDQELLSFAMYDEKIAEFQKQNGKSEDTGIEYRVNLMKLDEDKSLLVLTVFYLTHIPGPYTPFEEHVFVIHQDKANKVNGFSRYPNKLIRNPDGSYWISSYAVPGYDLTAADQDTQGYLALIDKNGVSHNINQQLKAQDIDLLHADNGMLLIKAYNDRLDPLKAAKTDGYYSIDTRLSVSKLADSIRGTAYVGQNKQVFAMVPDKNTITNITTKKSHHWWDYELRSDL